jgi:hypothetical protein
VARDVQVVPPTLLLSSDGSLEISDKLTSRTIASKTTRLASLHSHPGCLRISEEYSIAEMVPGIVRDVSGRLTVRPVFHAIPAERCRREPTCSASWCDNQIRLFTTGLARCANRAGLGTRVQRACLFAAGIAQGLQLAGKRPHRLPSVKPSRLARFACAVAIGGRREPQLGICRRPGAATNSNADGSQSGANHASLRGRRPSPTGFQTLGTAY